MRNLTIHPIAVNDVLNGSFDYRSPNMVDMQCLFQEGPTKLLMGGHQDKLLELDITKMVETAIVSVNYP